MFPMFVTKHEYQWPYTDCEKSWDGALELN